MKQQVPSHKTLYIWLLGSFVALVLAAGFWTHFVWMSPERVFESMLRSTLQTSGMTKQTVLSSGDMTLTVDQRQQFVSQPLVQTTTHQTSSDTTVSTETISTPQNQYVRFTGIDLKTGDTKDKDFSGVLNVWGSGQQAESVGQGPLLSEVLGGDQNAAFIVPMAMVSEEYRVELMQLLIDHAVFQPSYSDVKREQESGRTVYVYDVQLQLQAYAAYLKRFGEAMGAGEYVSSLDPAEYAGAPSQKLKMYVDPISRQLVRIDYNFGIERTDRYMNYGLVRNAQLPTTTISSEELQRRVVEIGSGE